MLSNIERKSSQRHKVDLADHVHQTPLNKFSLREYVFTGRSNDIKANWPFSQKALQLCLKHGVKDVLPPFEGLYSVKNRSSNEFEVGTSLSESVKASNSPGEAIDRDDQVLVDSPGNVQMDSKISETCTEFVTSYESNGENKSLSTRTQLSPSEEEPLFDYGRSSTAVESNTLLEFSSKVEAAAVDHRLSRKSDYLARVHGKKCRLAVKLGGNPDQSSTQNIGLNTCSVSEAMAAKVCPVCKTFSSSSNTTLNAHIDQCLSGESSSKWSMDSKLPRYRNKPRKVRLMVDIYATAKPCTLEELDKRNGTNWASVLSLPAETAKTSSEEQEHSMTVHKNRNTSEVGAVYVDSSGTKLRILSKLDDPPSRANVAEDLGPKKSLKEGKGTRFLSAKKKREYDQKHQKYLKVSPQSKKMCSRITNSSQVQESEEGVSKAEESTQIKADNSRLQHFGHLGAIRQWVCSKRTSLARKSNLKSGPEPLCGKLHITREFLCEDDRAKIDFTGKSWKRKSSNLSGKPTSASESSERLQANDMDDQPSWAKRTGPSLFCARMGDGVLRSLSPPKRKACQFNKYCSPIGDSHICKTSNLTGNAVNGHRSKAAAYHSGHSDNPEVFCDPKLRETKSSDMVVNNTEASTLRRRMSPAEWSCSFKSKSNMIKKSSSMKKSQVNCMAGMDEELAWSMKTRNHGNQSKRKISFTNPSIGRRTVIKMGKERAANIPSWGKSASRGPLPENRRNKRSKPLISSAGIDEALRNFADLESHSGYKPSSQVATVQQTFYFGKSSGYAHHRLETKSNFVRTVDGYAGPLYEAVEVDAGVELNESEMFIPDDVDDGFRQPNTQVMEGPSLFDGEGHSILQVDPIPIPGPPGSFLPSPGQTGSEDFQGTSSLTSRGQSSRGQYDLVDGDSWDSPISGTSTIFNFMASGSGSKSSCNLKPVRSLEDHDNENSSFSSTRSEPLWDTVAIAPLNASGGAEKIIYEEGNYELQARNVEKVNQGYRNDEQPCFCQRKERTSQKPALNCQEQLLRQQGIASLGVDMLERQLGCNLDSVPKNLEAMSRMVQLANCPSSGSEKAFLPVMKAVADVASFKCSPDAGTEFSGHGESEPASHSGSNPVLRLMGKNLMVVNMNEAKPIFSAQAKAHAPTSHSLSQHPTFTGVFPSFIQLQGQNSITHVELPGSVISRHETHGAIGACNNRWHEKHREYECEPRFSIETIYSNTSVLHHNNSDATPT